MKRKPSVEAPQLEPAEVIPAPVNAAPAPRKEKCVVCGGESAPNSTETLCWVCRRLKISAWRDTDQQAMVQE